MARARSVSTNLSHCESYLITYPGYIVCHHLPWCPLEQLSNQASEIIAVLRGDWRVGTSEKFKN